MACASCVGIYFQLKGLGFEFNAGTECLVFIIIALEFNSFDANTVYWFSIEFVVALLKNRWCVCMVIKAFSLMVLSCRLLVSVCVCVVLLDTQFDLVR